MKAIRTYRMEGVWFFQDTTFMPDDDSLEDPLQCTCSAVVSPFGPQEGDAIGCIPVPELPMDLRIQELNHFLTLLQYMYNYGS